MIERTMKIKLENGLEARPVAVLVQKASMHDSTIYIHAEGKKGGYHSERYPYRICCCQPKR